MPQYDGAPTDSVPMLKRSISRPDLNQLPPEGARRVYITERAGGLVHIQAVD